MFKNHIFKRLYICFLIFLFLFKPFPILSAESSIPYSNYSWWIWPLILLIVTFLMGIVAVLGGVGGGVLFVPIISGFFPFHIDFVRGTGLLVALCGALAAGPELLKSNLASLRLAMPMALIASTMAIVGAMVGLSLPSQLIELSLGFTILFIVIIMLFAKKADLPNIQKAIKSIFSRLSSTCLAWRTLLLVHDKTIA